MNTKKDNKLSTNTSQQGDGELPPLTGYWHHGITEKHFEMAMQDYARAALAQRAGSGEALLAGYALQHKETGVFGSWLYPTEHRAMIAKQQDANYSGPRPLYTAQPAAVQLEELRNALTELTTVQKKLIEANAEIAALNLATSAKPDSRRDAVGGLEKLQKEMESISWISSVEGDSWDHAIAAVKRRIKELIGEQPTENASLTDAEIDDMIFGYAPNCPIGEGRELLQVVLSMVNKKWNKQ